MIIFLRIVIIVIEEYNIKNMFFVNLMFEIYLFLKRLFFLFDMFIKYFMVDY